MRAPFLAALLCVLSVPAWAKPSQYGVDNFSGDRYIRVAQPAAARDVNRSMRCPPPHCQRGRASKARYLYRTKRHRQIVPIPTRRPGAVSPLTQASAVEPLSAARGFGREVGRAAPAVIGGRPAGCPHRFCGCALAIKLFGRIIPKLNLAANWLTFPRTAPQPGMVAARRGHVFKLMAHVRGNTWRVWDANSGRGRIRIHDRSIAGYQIVNPRA